jgi:hypothetical protein
VEVFPVVFFRPFKPFDSCLKDDSERFLCDFAENVGDCVLSDFPVLDLVFTQFCFQIPKKEEATCFAVWTARRTQDSLDLSYAKAFGRSLSNLRTPLSRRMGRAFSRFFFRMLTDFVSQTQCTCIEKEL